MPRHMLATDEMPSIIRLYFAENPDWVERSVAYGQPHPGLTVSYFWNSTRQAVVMPSPLAVSDVQGDDALEPICSEILTAIQGQLGTNDFSLSASLLGKGGERHYVAYFRGHDQQQLIFDSKNSDVDTFLRSADSPSFRERLLSFFLAPFKALALSMGIGRQVNARFMEQEVWAPV